ncbi:MAG: oligosaccharide flippase family protein [Patescibacteria group bacterium]
MPNEIVAKAKNILFSGTIIVTIGLFVTNILSYLLQLFLGRYLSLTDYGVFTALLSLFSILGIATTALTTSLIKLTSELKANEDYEKLTNLFWQFVKISILVVFVFVTVLYFARDFLGSYLNIEDHYIFPVFGMYIGLTFLNAVPSSYLQGLLRFKAFAFFSVLSSSLRLVISTLFVIFGLSVAGVFYGMSIAVVLSFFVSLFLLSKNFIKYNNNNLKPFYKKVLVFSTPVLFVNVGMMILNNIDVILVKHFFDSETAGLYSGVVTMGKILLFGAGTIGIVMFPQISELYTKGVPYLAKFKEFFLIQLVLILGGLAFFTLFPELITKIMFGHKFLESVSLIPKYTLFVGIYVLINFMILFFLAINKTRVFLLQVPIVIFQYAFINLKHSTLEEIININIFVSALLLLLVLLYFYFVLKEEKPSHTIVVD